MASYNELLALIDAYINQNGVQAITGQVLNGVLRAMVDQLGRGYSIMGAADPTTDPGTPDGPESWFASVPGTYTNFDGIQIADGELALLSYTPSDGFAKNTLYDGFKEVTAQIDGNVGTPAVGVSYANGILSFDFHNMKGETGDPAGFGSVSATIDDNIGTPSVSVAASGPDTARNFAFNFRNLKGETGVTSVLATVDNTSGNPQCAVSLQGQQLTLAFTGLKGAQGDTGSSVDYPFTIVNNLTTNDATQALSAAMGVQLETEVSQLEAKVTDLFNKTSAPRIDIQDGKFIGTNGAEVSNTACSATDYIEVSAGMVVEFYNTFASPNTQQCIAYYGEGKVFVDYFRLYNYAIGKTSFTIPYGVKYVRVSIYNLSIENFYFSILPVSNNVHIETSSIVSTRLQYVDNTLLNENGVESSNINFLITGYIPVADVDKLKYFNTIKSFPSANNVFYDKDKTLVSVFANRSDNSEVEEQVPLSAKFVRFSIYKPDVDKFFVSTYNSEAVSTHQQILNNLFEHDPETNYIDRNSDSWVKDALIDGNGNVAQGYTGFYASPFIAITPGTSYYFYRVFTGYYAFYDENGTVISAHGNDNTLTNPFTAPSGAKYMRITCISQTWKEDCWIYTSNATPPDYKEVISNNYIPGGSTKTFCDYDGNDISVFNKIACVGDSLTQGVFNHNEGGTEEYLIDTKYSYPAILQKLSGVECENLGVGGLTSAQWYNHYKNDDLSGYDCVIIQLGVNDAIQNQGWTQESIDAFTNIINKFKQENNGIKVFVATIIPAISYSGAAYTAVSQGIRDLVTSLSDENVMLLDMAQYGSTGDSSAYNAGHLSAYGYYRLAQDYKGLIGYVMSQNKNDFRFIQFIGTTYSYNG